MASSVNFLLHGTVQAVWCVCQLANKETKMKFEFLQDAEGFTEIVEIPTDGSSIKWDVRFQTKAEATAAIDTYKRRLKCRRTWGLAA